MVADGQGRASEDLQITQGRIPLGDTCPEGVAPNRVGPLRQEEDRLPALGEFGGQLHVLRAERGKQDRNACAHRMIDQLEWLAQATALPGWQRDPVVVALVLQALACPHLAADLQHLTGAADRRVVGHAVEALDNLRPRCAKTQDVAAAGDVVQPGCGHGRQRRRARIQLQDARGQLDPFGLGGEVAQRAHRVERVRLGHEHDVEPGPLEVGDLRGYLFETASVVNALSDSHR